MAKHRVHHSKKRKHHRRRGHGLRGVSLANNPVVLEVKNDVINVGAVLGGFFIGNLGGKFLGKLLKTDTASAGIMGILKKAAVPLIVTATGAGIAYFSRQQSGKKDGTNPVLYLGLGVMGSGLNQGLKVVLKKDFLAGLTESGDKEAIEARYFKESADKLNKLRELNSKVRPMLGADRNVYSRQFLRGDEYGENPADGAVRSELMMDELQTIL